MSSSRRGRTINGRDGGEAGGKPALGRQRFGVVTLTQPGGDVVLVEPLAERRIDYGVSVMIPI
jgi:hypothetical protein